ncbi:K+/H+ antiporter subunit F [Brevundimonas diminuta]|jgi:multicomponent K+:H+ antiporter subunit F|uniref:K+/H+ antiporter subunit F n=1 Tax=Brevundimonas guildfordensis TaxID=2762241 RepID=A0ABR8R0W6_9CAUL|nr:MULTISPECIES: K+/H+ antiporter subunit F [Brevundimonas]MBD7941432.1 K+/H+ antiporter subunit F [Brevundimonas guildfordensis]MCO8030908.1 K+/H+ antiporter subunit F [Brevundimonas diminuta]QBQ49609.1 K+/H+ antiporter subunit F [Brevundimonas naejangsanensis]
MSGAVFYWALVLAQLFLAAAGLIGVWRIAKGPRAQDRILGLDTLYQAGMLLVVAFGVRTGTQQYFYAAVIIGMLGFTSSVALAKFLMRGEVIE